MREHSMLQAIIQKTLRVPLIEEQKGNGESVTRQLDIALMGTGFKLSKDLFEHLASLHPIVVKANGAFILDAVRELVGDHVRHNVYFINFPEGVPDTTEFWITEILRLFFTGKTKYGQYQHTYEEMLALHDDFIPSAKDRVTVLHMGKSLVEEIHNLYLSLASSNIPLSGIDRMMLEDLADMCLTESQPEDIPVRENRAIINCVRLNNDVPLLINTTTDVLRLACALSGGDVTLQETTKFVSFNRKLRRALLSALHETIKQSRSQLLDIHQYREQWKRLGERLHPHEYKQYELAGDVFAVARGDMKVSTLEARIEKAFLAGDTSEAITLLMIKPGLFVRSIDRLLLVVSEQEQDYLLESIQKAFGKTSGRVLLSLREHLQNRIEQQSSRIFTNRKGRAWVTPDTRKSLDLGMVERIIGILDFELQKRMPHIPSLVVDQTVLQVAIPLSDKNKSNGFTIMPRGSKMLVENGITRFFVYWKQKAQRTDYDLSMIMLDKNFQSVGQVSYTNLSYIGAVHSGDLTRAPHGATEFIDVDFQRVPAQYVVPCINIYNGEDFTEVESCFFGFMSRTPEQAGKPFEAATVRVKSDLRGKGRVALPLVFMRDEDDKWTAKWMHLYVKGHPNFNRVEANHLSVGVLAQSIVDRQYLTLSYLIGLMRLNTDNFCLYDVQTEIAMNLENDHPVTHIGLTKPEGLCEGAKVYTLDNLRGLIPS